MIKKAILFSATSLLFFSCEKDSTNDVLIPEQKIVIDTTVKETYDGNVKSILSASCTSCHSSSFKSGGLNLDNYTDVKNASNLIIQRISLNDGQPLLMPQGGPKMSDDKIAVIKKWKEDGLLEK